MIIDVGKFRTQEDRADCELRFVVNASGLIFGFMNRFSFVDNSLVRRIQALRQLKVLTFSHHYVAIDPAIFDHHYCDIPMKILRTVMMIFSNH